MRNILIHEYFGVDVKAIWHTVVEDLPKLKALRGLLPPSPRAVSAETIVVIGHP